MHCTVRCRQHGDKPPAFVAPRASAQAGWTSASTQGRAELAVPPEISPTLPGRTHDLTAARTQDVARTCVEVLRMEAGTNPTDPALTALVGELAVADQHFRVWWAEHRVAHQDFGSKRITHSLVGELTLDWDTFRYAGAPEQQLVLWSAEPGTSDAERLADLAHGTAQGPPPS